MTTLFINTCVRKNSRTMRLAEHYLSRIEDEIITVHPVEEGLCGLDGDMLAIRDEALMNKDYDHPVLKYAGQFAKADTIVIAAPYWDLSFPAALKQYFELINAMGITFAYTSDGFPKPLCKANVLYYVTTAGGAFCPEEYGYGYVKALAENFYGIADVKLIKAVGFDVDGADESKILQEAIGRLAKDAGL